MARILSFNSSHNSSKFQNNSEDENFFKKLWGTFQSLDKFTKLFLLSMFLFLAAVPTITREYLDTRQRASETPITPPFPIASPTSPVEVSARVFVTSTTYSGNLGGLAGADAKCQERANTASFSGVWKAWLSDGSTSASSRLNHSAGLYILAKDSFNSVVANNWDDLVDGNALAYPIVADEFGKYWTSYLVWTNTDVKGQVNTSPVSQGTGHCNNWISTSSSDVGRMGSIMKDSPNWTADPALYKPCNVTFMHLYCFEQTVSKAITPIVTSLSTPTPTNTPTSTPTPFVCTACSADIKKDSMNRVNSADYAVLASCYGKSLDYKLSNGYVCANADIDKDGKIGDSDYKCLQSQYFKLCISASSATPTPFVFPTQTNAIPLPTKVLLK